MTALPTCQPPQTCGSFPRGKTFICMGWTQITQHPLLNLHLGMGWTPSLYLVVIYSIMQLTWYHKPDPSVTAVGKAMPPWGVGTGARLSRQVGTGLLVSKDMRETLFQWCGPSSAQPLQPPTIMINLFELFSVVVVVNVEVVLVVGFEDWAVVDIAERWRFLKNEIKTNKIDQTVLKSKVGWAKAGYVANAYSKELWVISTGDLNCCFCDQFWTDIRKHCVLQSGGWGGL